MGVNLEGSGRPRNSIGVIKHVRHNHNRREIANGKLKRYDFRTRGSMNVIKPSHPGEDGEKNHGDVEPRHD